MRQGLLLKIGMDASGRSLIHSTFYCSSVFTALFIAFLIIVSHSELLKMDGQI